jgi:heme exporter protein A
LTHAAITARGLEKRFGPSIALRGLDLEIPAGASLAVLGPNGAGKTTLLRLMAGMVRPTAGSLEIAGHRAGARQARARVGWIGHATSLYAALTARENLIFAARLHSVSEAAARAEALLVEVGLERAADRAAGGFSRGMAQRLSIARGLVHDPDVVLLDEPFTGLDRRAAEQLADRLAGLRRGGRTLVLVTHDAHRAARVADAAIVLSEGRIATRLGGDGLDPAALESAYLAATDRRP